MWPNRDLKARLGHHMLVSCRHHFRIILLSFVLNTYVLYIFFRRDLKARLGHHMLVSCRHHFGIILLIFGIS
jgi:hypothetical protein